MRGLGGGDPSRITGNQIPFPSPDGNRGDAKIADQGAQLSGKLELTRSFAPILAAYNTPL